MMEKRTDLALEAHELWRESTEETGELEGVRAGEETAWGYPVTRVDILDAAGAAALGKPAGSYRTVDLSGFWQREADFFRRAVLAVGTQLRALLPETGPVLVVGLGNRGMTPDAVGPLAADHVLVTRHLIAAAPADFGSFRSAAVLRPGVLGTTGVESVEAVLGVAERVQPGAVIAVDALAARRTERLCRMVQLSDSGIVPGSGVGNHRAALDRETLGVPVVAIGVPTVVDAATLAADLLEEAGLGAVAADWLRAVPQTLTVTPQDIDAQVRELGKVVGYAIDWAVHQLEIDEISALLT